MEALNYQRGSSSVGLATAFAIFIGLLEYAHYYAFNPQQRDDLAQSTERNGTFTSAIREDTKNKAISGLVNIESGRIDSEARSHNYSVSPNSINDDSAAIQAEEFLTSNHSRSDPQLQAIQKGIHQSGSAAGFVHDPTIPSGLGSALHKPQDAMMIRHDGLSDVYVSNRANNRGSSQYRGQSQGRGRGRGDGEFAFNMSLKSRSRMRTDAEIDSDLEADQRSHQVGRFNQALGVYAAYRYAYDSYR